MSRVLVTGGSSPLGDLLIPRLVAEHDVIAIARSDEAAQGLSRKGIEVVRYDLEQSGPPPVPRVSAVVHAAGIGLAAALAPLLLATAPRRLVIVSSASATVPDHPRRDEVMAGERLLLAAAPEVVILRPTMIYGSWRDRNVRRLWRRLHGLPVIPRVRGGGLLQPVLADDVAEALAEALRAQRPGVLTVGGPTPVRFNDLLRGLASAMGKPTVGPALPLGLMAELVRRAPVPSRAANGKHAVEMLLLDRAVPPPAEFGFSYAPTDLDDGLRLAVARYRSTGASPDRTRRTNGSHTSNE